MLPLYKLFEINSVLLHIFQWSDKQPHDFDGFSYTLEMIIIFMKVVTQVIPLYYTWRERDNKVQCRIWYKIFEMTLLALSIYIKMLIGLNIQ